MEKDRLLAFSDGIFGIIMTIMVLELKTPHETTLNALLAQAPVFFSYVVSWLYLAIYWNNHHHLLHTVKSVSGRILWANTNLLFWLSFIPFATAWLGETSLATIPTAIYGLALLMPAISYKLLQEVLIRHQGPGSKLKKAIGKDAKGIGSVILYALAIPLSFSEPMMSRTIYVGVALLWLIPDQRIERLFTDNKG